MEEKSKGFAEVKRNSGVISYGKRKNDEMPEMQSETGNRRFYLLGLGK